MKNMTITPVRTLALCAATLFTFPASFAQSASTVLVASTADKNPASDHSTMPSGVKDAAQQDAVNAKKWSIYWGWNHATYSQSDIRFWGVDHDFTIRNVAAADRQSDVTAKNITGVYLSPGKLTIPQTNLRIAYQYSADTAIALNLDHMKYVVSEDQVVPISGQIKGVTQSGTQVLATNFLTFEHTDGLNVISLELEKQQPLDIFGPRLPARVFALAGIGIVLPKSNVSLNMVGRARNDEFHLAGYSAGLGAGLDVDFYKDFFFRTAYKFGYVNLPDVLTSAQGDKASHKFTYNEVLIAVGMRF